jgi:peroxiredoxin|tara:strand:+ start:97 stop:753 length:657 start_codon:yes stop_codon:yes gene_type:complete
MSLLEQIKEFQKGFLEQVPEETLKIMQSGTEKLIKSGIAEKCLKEGDKIPAFTLPNPKNERVSSDIMLSKGPLVINFYRGAWCPYCNLELRAYQEVLPEILNLGAQLVAISPNLPDNSLSSIEKHSLTFEVLSDIGNKISRQFGLVFTLDALLQPLYKQFGIDIPASNGDESYELPIPATYVVNPDGIIKLAFVDADYTKRLDPNEVIETLRNLSQKT